MKKLMEIEKLNLYYGEKQALDNISLNIEKNEILALIGPSGCGKSTFLRTLNRMNDLVPICKITGKITYEDKNIYSKETDVYELRTKIGMVFQRPNPFPKTIYENITYGPKCQGIKGKEELEKIVENSLKEAALWEEVKDRLHTSALGLSGGQQQRLCIARAIAMQPEVILMDEPTSALDPIATAKIEELILNLKKNYTVVIVTHSMAQAARVSDKTAFFLMGELVEIDETSKIFANPEHQKTEDYITGRFG